MKKKMQRVPDFSSKKPGQKVKPTDEQPAPVQAPKAVSVKPQATSSKSGHRGG